jgi:uncharacterized protein (DUF2141 family)
MSRHRRLVLVLSCVALAAVRPEARQVVISDFVPETIPEVVDLRQIGPGPRDPSQPPVMRRIPVGTGTIAGIVTAGDSGRPVARASVRLSGNTTAAASAPGASIDGMPAAGSLPLSRAAVTDAQGRFTFEALPAGRFMLSVQHDQFLSTNYGARKPNRPGTAIQLADGQRMTVTVPMLRGGVISGIVYDETGQPLMNAQIRAMVYQNAGGIRRLGTTSGASTDDRGVYRMHGLQPGDYVVAATPNAGGQMMVEQAEMDAAAFAQALAAASARVVVAPGTSASAPTFVSVPMSGSRMIGPPPGFAPTYYPASPSIAGASRITLGPGEERLGVDVSIVPTRAVNVTGTVAGIPGANVVVMIRLVSDDPDADGIMVPSTRAGRDGTFVLRGVSPGRYVALAQTIAAPVPMMNDGNIRVEPPPPLDGTQRLWASAQVVVDAGTPPPPLTMVLQPGRSIAGQILFEMARPPDLYRARQSVTLVPAPAAQPTTTFGPPPRATIGPDGQFVLSGVIPGRYFLRADGGTMKSAIVDGEDTLDAPLVIDGDRDITNVTITLTDRKTTLAGRIMDPAGAAASDCTIVIASADRRYWTPASRRIAASRPAIDGRYQFRNLPPGDYLLAAVTDLEPGGQYDPAFLGALVGASVRVTLAEGASRTQDLRVGP